ncbi:proline--tRNA ligase [Lederbergia lenta]|uniref:Proline--tRNA ligase n=1 Tax=Lederbergia lenta TaxID=1467 RepID=A0A2X4W6D4_LEDLE|nr:proline--tRNA ligase [Lederbergia lenta]MCM3110117.1 proline--tRNA ligase [Lederbergia lenta]MEC2324314.1 proline--tRNA ligase [Lederbergia lenta]SQI60197.1 prolyl-tRNA synthetase [Lederbergia lenta]
MKQSRTLIPTLREMPADAEIKSHQFLLRAGFIRQVASGVYTYMPLAKRVLDKIENIIREEMENAGAAELLMPALQPAELWQESGRWHTYGDELMRLRDRHGRGFALGATHEEVITSLVNDDVQSYKKMPLTLYQIQTKFRDEQRPRFGLLRGREFIMKDAYSFHTSEESLDEVYQKIYKAYTNIFTRCELDFRAVLADSGAIGGKDTQEFMVLSDIGEDTIVYSDTSDYAANLEMAEAPQNYDKPTDIEKELVKVETPAQKSIEEVSRFLNSHPGHCIKSLVFKADDEYVMILVRGDHEVNDIKVKNGLNAKIVELAEHVEIEHLLECPIGSLGPINLNEKMKVYADHAVKALANAICGANEDGYHYMNVQPCRDFTVDKYMDFRFIKEGDPSPDGKGKVQFARGIEVGHIFKLGKTYSEAMGASYLDVNGRSQSYIMGCYGIGVSRTLSAVAEQFNDENGLVWPVNIAPYHIHVIPVNTKDEAQSYLAEELYELFKSNRYEVLLDDRSERPGVKFKDSDLIGLPVRITVGKKANDGIVEVKVRKTGEMFEVTKDEILPMLAKILQEA